MVWHLEFHSHSSMPIKFKTDRVIFELTTVQPGKWFLFVGFVLCAQDTHWVGKLAVCVSEQLENQWNWNECANVDVDEDLLSLYQFISFHIYFPCLLNLVVSVSIPSEHCLVKICELSTAFLDTDEKMLIVCCLRKHNISKFKCTSWLMRSSTYVLFIPLQLSWQHNPFFMWRYFVRMAWRLFETLFPNQMRELRTFARIRYLTKSVRLRSVDNERLFTFRAKHVFPCVCEARNEFNVDCI